MTNREKYKQAFSALHASDDISLEGTAMKTTNRKFRMKPALAACLCVILLLGCIGAVYAADVGGIQEIIHVWIGGKQVDATVTDYQDSSGNNGFTFTIAPEDGDGDGNRIGGGGVAIDADGTERPLTAEEVAESFACDIVTQDDGSIWLYYYDQSHDITELLVDGACKVVLEDDGEAVYFDIRDNGSGGYGYSRSPDPTGTASDYTVLK